MLYALLLALSFGSYWLLWSALLGDPFAGDMLGAFLLFGLIALAYAYLHMLGLLHWLERKTLKELKAADPSFAGKVEFNIKLWWPTIPRELSATIREELTSQLMSRSFFAVLVLNALFFLFYGALTSQHLYSDTPLILSFLLALPFAIGSLALQAYKELDLEISKKTGVK